MDIRNYDGGKLLAGTSGADVITNYGANVTVDAGDGNDTVQNTHLTYSYGTNAIIDAGAGNDSIYNDTCANVSIEAGEGDDTIENSGTEALIRMGAGNDFITNGGGNVSIYAGTGNDTIRNYASNALINGGAGDDFISLPSYSQSNVIEYTAGDGNDTITGFNAVSTLQIAGSSYSTTKSGNDIIVIVGNGSMILTGAADLSELNINGESAPLISWKLDGSSATYGSLVITGVTSLDGIYLNGTTVTISAASLGAKNVTVSDGYTLALGSDVSSALTTNNWSLSSTTATLRQMTTAGYRLEDNVITYTANANKTLFTLSGVTSLYGIYLIGKVVTVSAASLSTGKVSITGEGYKLALGSDVSSSTTKKSWSLSGTTATYKQTTSAGYSLNGNEIIYSKAATKTLVTVKGVTSLDGLKLSKKVVTVSSASLGTKDITISDGYTLALGSDVDGSTTKKSWTLKNSTATYKRTTAAGYSLVDNEIIYSKKSSKTLATVKGAVSKSGLKVSGKTIKLPASALSSKVTVSGDYVFDFASDYSKATITGSSSDDTIIARGKNIFVKGGDGSDIFALKSTGTIHDYEEEDKVSLSSAAEISVSGDDVIFNDKVTLKGAADKSITYIENGEEKIFKYTPAAVKFNAKGTSVTLLAEYEEDSFDIADYSEYKNTVVTIKASAVLQPLEIFGNKKANKIVGTSEDDFIDGKTGSDTISGGKGKDTLVGGKGNDSLSGGSGNDSLWGGAGDDTLFGGAGKDIFVYHDGDGTDVIEDFDASLDKIRVLSGDVGTPTVDSAGDVTFAIGDGEIVVKGGADKYIPVYDSGKNILMKYNPR